MFFLKHLPSMARFGKVLLGRKGGWERRAQRQVKGKGGNSARSPGQQPIRLEFKRQVPFLVGESKGQRGASLNLTSPLIPGITVAQKPPPPYSSMLAQINTCACQLTLLSQVTSPATWEFSLQKLALAGVCTGAACLGLEQFSDVKAQN